MNITINKLSCVLWCGNRDAGALRDNSTNDIHRGFPSFTSMYIHSCSPDKAPAQREKIWPKFWPKDPKLCFAQIESQFAIRQITVSRTKFDHVVSSISPEFATEYETCFSTPPNDTPDI